jgi:hypothetical protein
MLACFETNFKWLLADFPVSASRLNSIVSGLMRLWNKAPFIRQFFGPLEDLALSIVGGI